MTKELLISPFTGVGTGRRLGVSRVVVVVVVVVVVTWVSMILDLYTYACTIVRFPDEQRARYLPSFLSFLRGWLSAFMAKSTHSY